LQRLRGYDTVTPHSPPHSPDDRTPMSQTPASPRPEPLLYETHMHTPLCRHAVGLPEEYAHVAIQRGLKGIVVTCHNPMPFEWGRGVRMALEEYDTYIALVYTAQQRMLGRCDIRLGLETDYVPGLEKETEKLLKRAPLNHVLGSVHPQTREYHERFFTGDPLAYQKTYFKHLAEAAETKLFDTLSHPDLIKNLFPRNWRHELVLDDVRLALDRIAKTGCAMELNTSGLYKDVQEMNPGPWMLREIHARGIPVVVGADAHSPARCGDQFPQALHHLRRIGFSEVNFFLERRRISVPIDAALATLADQPTRQAKAG
jgi:histidinol-phosphatase (PHP family)